MLKSQKYSLIMKWIFKRYKIRKSDWKMKKWRKKLWKSGLKVAEVGKVWLNLSKYVIKEEKVCLKIRKYAKAAKWQLIEWEKSLFWVYFQGRVCMCEKLVHLWSFPSRCNPPIEVYFVLRHLMVFAHLLLRCCWWWCCSWLLGCWLLWVL